MNYVLLSNDPDLDPLLRIKVPRRSQADQPCLAFVSEAICRYFMGVRGIDESQCTVTTVLEASRKAKFPRSILVFSAEQQILDTIADPEGYDYESLIQTHVA